MYIYVYIHMLYIHILGLAHQAVSQEKSIADMLGAGSHRQMIRVAFSMLG